MPIINPTDISIKSIIHLNFDETVILLFLSQYLVGKYVTKGSALVLSIYGIKRKFVIDDIKHTGKMEENTIYKVDSTVKIAFINGEKPKSHSGKDTTEKSIIGGLGDELNQLRELVEIQIKRPDIFVRYGVKPPRGVLLYGPPGTGKTLLARVIAEETGANCFNISAPEIMGKFYGESEAKLRDLFIKAREKAPSIIFIDEVDAIAPKRDSSESEVSKRIVGTLLSLMDGLDSNVNDGVVVIAATNRPNMIDPALRRPGRFDREIEIGIPNDYQRKEILELYLKNIPNTLKNEDIAQVSSITHGYVGADIYNLCKEGALNALKRIRQETSLSDISFESVELLMSIDDIKLAMSEIRPSAMREIMVDIPKVKWDDIGGYEDVKQRLKEAVEWPLLHPEAFKRMGILPPKGILLYGPPGCSKTLLAKAIATEAGLNFIPIKGPELFNKYVGESERAVRDVFRKARQASPSVIFFDELDAIGGERGQGSDSTSVHDRVLAQMLNELDGIEPLKNVLFLAATNRPDIIDKALMRPGRIDRIIYVSPPDFEARKRILQISLRKTPHVNFDFEELANITDGLSGAELTSLCRESCLLAMEEDINVEQVDGKFFMQALESIKPTISKKMLDHFESYAKSFK